MLCYCKNKQAIKKPCQMTRLFLSFLKKTYLATVAGAACGAGAAGAACGA